jgi:folate-binding protein YgfZ
VSSVKKIVSMSAELKALQRSAGAVFATFAGQELPARFTSLECEWAAVRQRCGLLDARFRGVLRLSGTDRTTFVQGMVTNDVAALKNGEGTSAALLTIQGRIASDMRIYTLAEEIWMDVPLQRVAAVREHLEHHIVADDVEFITDTDLWAPLVAVEGPEASGILATAVGAGVQGLPPFGHQECRFDGASLRIAAVSHAGEVGYLFFGPSASTRRLWEACRNAGAEPVGMEALDVLRVEAGIPWYDRDMDESTLISEVGLERAISFRKGCYLGQEVVERVAARGQVQRKLVGLTCDSPLPPPADAPLSHDGKEAGFITSALWSPARQSVIALGYVRQDWWDPGCELQVALPNGTATARVVELPFYKGIPHGMT